MPHFPAESQVNAARAVYQAMPGWRASVEGLDRLRSAMPGWDTPSVLVKVAAVNSLYSTNVYAVVRMAEHIAEMVRRRGVADDPVGLVTLIAALPGRDQTVQRHHTSFASKFCHFFVDPERFPILDTLAKGAVEHHLGRPVKGYGAFFAAVEELRGGVKERPSLRDLDAYLWLKGQQLAGTRASNQELRDLAESRPELLDGLRCAGPPCGSAQADGLDAAGTDPTQKA